MAETGGKQHLVFTDAEINAAASTSEAMIADGVRFHDDTAVEAYGQPFDPATDAAYTQLQGQSVEGRDIDGDLR